MQDVRSTARRSVEDFVSAWLAGDRDKAAGVCSPSVRWWTPVSDQTAPGPAEAWMALERVLAPVPRPIEITALAVSEDGSSGVVEMRAGVDRGAGRSTFVTSVIRLAAGKVVEGRTYADLNTPVEARGRKE